MVDCAAFGAAIRGSRLRTSSALEAASCFEACAEDPSP